MHTQILQTTRYEQAKRITLIGAFVNGLLGVLKLAGGLFFHSHALIADGLHSFSDLITDIMVVIASKFGSQIADQNHPYGHQRIETAATFFLSMLLVITGASISWDGIQDTFLNTQAPSSLYALAIAGLSIVLNELIFFITKRIGERIQSDLVIANAWHHRSDAASSFVVFLGILGSVLGYPFFDPIAALLVGLLIIHMGISYAWNSIKELIDTGIPAKELIKIEAVIAKIQGVNKIHQLRTRSMGKDIFIDVHIVVSPFLSVSEGHYIAQLVHYNLLTDIPNAKDVTVHIDPEDDEIVRPSIVLPSRDCLEEKFLNHWKKEYPMLHSWVIHYLEGQLIIDLIYQEDIPNVSELHAALKQSTHSFEHPIELRFYVRKI